MKTGAYMSPREIGGAGSPTIRGRSKRTFALCGRAPCDHEEVSRRTSWAVFGIVVAGLGACSSSSSSPTAVGDAGSLVDATGAGGDAARSGDGGAQDAAGALDAGGDAGTGCGLDFYTSDYPPACALLLDKYCCDAERACGADATCVAFVACVDACPSPRQGACVAACGGGGAKLDALAQCTKTPPYTVPPGIDCTWPQ
jgi:hypothetical protein